MSLVPVAPQSAGKAVKMLILGDAHLDTLIIPMKWNSGKGNWWRLRRRGGAWLLEEVIRAAIEEIRKKVEEKGSEIKVESYDHKTNGVEDGKIQSSLDKEYQSAAAILGLFAKRTKSSLGDADKVYRVERLSGQNHFGLPKERRSLQHFLQEGHVEGGLIALAFDAVLTGVSL
jgi:hypothetical protein